MFPGEDFGHAKEYSEDTSRVIDDEVDRMLREAEESCRELVEANRHALDLIAQALLDDETVSGAEVSRLIRVANGTEPDVPSPSQPHHGSPGVPVHGHVPGSQNPGALPSPHPCHRTSIRAGAWRGASHPTAPDGPGSSPHSGTDPGSRTSATAAHRCVALTGPMNERCTTPSPSAIATIGTASIW
ncbi:MAG: hypothetical protein R2789_08970 [Microthrixaceae bacterium]